ncbi:hypothetical protein PV08_08266 [Exophiala spinifera]|uniref:Zn(2)-C6 fungal-type domain-containing protein n=1 Tax=Exophiala spinifera TaxID=91928 RepID=A0A0D2BPP7_9EURO|nr:uncharacterized protein PV08_08266 [Exophiala spinifera]KIW13079.1 hypothetical protein PV08_08266 [Exophiala spinifera]
MPTLRKACVNCTSSKRKCVVQKPKCSRCSQKNLDCVYDLEPLNAPATEFDKVRAFGFKLSNYHALGRCIIKRLKSGTAGIDPAICYPGSQNVTEITRLGFDTVPELVSARRPASFVHPGLQVPDINNHVTALMERGARGVNSESFKCLMQVDIKLVSPQEALTAVQALLVHLAASSFSSAPAEQEEAELCLNILSEWTQHLFACFDAGMPKCQSPWQDWLLGESVRRTVFMAYTLNLSVTGYKYGYCPNWLFMESLPFDHRPGLWMAESPQAWIASAHARCGEEVGEQLKSYHEFAEACHGQTPDFGGDPFLTLLAFAHNGLGGN